MGITLASLLSVETKERIYQRGLEVAEAVGLDVTSWQPGDPTRSLYHYLAEILSTLELVVREYVASGFLDFASGDWLTVLAKQVYGVERQEATFASGTLTLSNAGGAQTVIDAGDLTFKSSITGKTYHNTSGGTLASGPGTALTLDWIADEGGSDSSVGVDEIDELVTNLLEVSISASSAGTGLDEQSDASLREECRDSIGALSPNGPAEAYKYVAKNADLTGVTDVTKAETDSDSDTGDVTLYIAGPDGSVAGASVTAVENAIARWATPLCITPTIVNATDVPVTITATVYIFDAVNATESEVQDAIQEKLTALFTELPIGGDDGELATSKILSAIFSAFPGYIHKVTLAAPAADVALTVSQVASINGTPSLTIVFTEVGS